RGPARSSSWTTPSAAGPLRTRGAPTPTSSGSGRWSRASSATRASTPRPCRPSAPRATTGSSSRASAAEPRRNSASHAFRVRRAPGLPSSVSGGPAGEGRSDAATGAQRGERLVEDGHAVLVAASLLHVREVRLVRLVAQRRRRALAVLAGREAAPRAVPGLRSLDVRLRGEARPRLVTVRAPVGHPEARRDLAALGLPERSRPDARPADRVTTCHVLSPVRAVVGTRSARTALGRAAAPL